MAELHQLESWHGGKVIATFKSDTRAEGAYVYCSGGTKIGTPRGQPNLHLYPEEEQEYMRKVITIIYKLVYPHVHKT